jgi:hypothetical protein
LASEGVTESEIAERIRAEALRVGDVERLRRVKPSSGGYVII